MPVVFGFDLFKDPYILYTFKINKNKADQIDATYFKIGSNICKQMFNV